VTMRRWTIGVIAVIGLLGAFAQPPITEPLLTDSAPWPTWGRDMRRSHFVDLAGPNTPAVLWFRLGGALEEPAIPGNSLWVPQHPAQGARYTRYTFYNPVNGRATGSFGPFWGQPSTPIFLNAAVFIVDNNFNPVLPPVAMGSAHALRRAVRVPCSTAPAPCLGSPMSFGRFAGFPAYRTSFGAFTDGFYIYPVFADNFGNITILVYSLLGFIVVDPSAGTFSVSFPIYLRRSSFDQIPRCRLAQLGLFAIEMAHFCCLGFHNGFGAVASRHLHLARLPLTPGSPTYP
jgi:hypothetical protein